MSVKQVVKATGALVALLAASAQASASMLACGLADLFPGDPRAPIYSITMSAGLPTNVTQANNQLTPFAGQGTASNDFVTGS